MVDTVFVVRVIIVTYPFGLVNTFYKINFGGCFLLSKRLKQERLSAKFTQKQLAEMVGMHEANYRRYELNTRQPTVDILVRLADALDISLDYLTGRTDYKAVYQSR